MPKRLHEIKKFNVGTITTPVETDTPEESASYSQNIDSMAKDGVLKGVPHDLRMYLRDSSDIYTSKANSNHANGATFLTLDNVETLGSELVDDIVNASNWSAYGSNSVAVASGSIQITYVDNALGAKNYLVDIKGLTADLTDNTEYKLTFSAKITGGTTTGKKVGLYNGSFSSYTSDLSVGYESYQFIFTKGSSDAYIDLKDLSSSNVVNIKDFSLKTFSGFAQPAGDATFIDSNGFVQKLTYSDVNTTAKRLTGIIFWKGDGTLPNDTDVYHYVGGDQNINFSSQALINNNGTRHLVYADESDSKIKKVDKVYNEDGAPRYYAEVSSTTESLTGTPSMVKNNKEVHIGMGNVSANKPLWCGFQNKGQFGTAASTSLVLEDAELHSPTTFPSFHKTVEYGNYIYGIAFDSQYLYYIDKSTSDYKIYISNLLFTKTKAMALDHNNYLMIVDDNNTIVWVDVSSTTHSVAKTYGISKAGSYTGEMTDIIETGASSTYYVWIAQSASATTHTSTGTPPQTATGLGLLQSASYPSGTSGTLTFTDRTPWQGFKTTLSLSSIEVGHWYHGNNTNGLAAPSTSYNDQMSIWTYPHSLVKGNDTQWVGWICEFTRSGNESTRIALNCLKNGSGTGSPTDELVDMNGPVLNYVKNSYAPVYDPSTIGNNDPDINKWFPVRLKHETSSLDIIGRYGKAGDLTNAESQSMWNGITSIYTHTAGHDTDDRIFITLNEEGSSGVTSTDSKILALNYNDPSPSTDGTMAHNHWFATDNTGTWAHSDDRTVFYYAIETGGTHTEGRLATNVYSTDASKVPNARLSSNDTGFTYTLFLNSGTGNGKIATLNATAADTYSSWTKRQVAPLDLTLSQTDMETAASSTFVSTKEYWYKASFIYDGYQESPLGIETQLLTPTNKNVQVTMDLYTDNLSSRVTAIALYRAESSGDGATEPTGFYRLVGTYDLDVSWRYSTDATWGTTRTKTIIDNYNLGASYEGRTGMSEVIDHITPNYSLSTDLNSHLFITKCHHQLIEDANNYLFKSKAYNYDQFNWINDFLVLPTTPTAIKSFNGRIWAFDDNNMYQIEPNSLYIENTIEGVGCISQKSIIVTDQGMCFCDRNNIYLHNGQNAVPISTTIHADPSTSYSWSNIDTSYDPLVTYSNQLKSFLIIFKDKTTTQYRIWAYNALKRRWDLLGRVREVAGTDGDTEQSEISALPQGVFIGKNGEINISLNDKWFVLYDDPINRKSWDWHSKKLTLGQDTQIKRFNNFNVTGSPSGSLGSASTGVAVKIDGTLATESGSLASFTVASGEQSGKHIQWILSGQTGEVDALGTVYRRKIVTSEQ